MTKIKLLFLISLFGAISQAQSPLTLETTYNGITQHWAAGANVNRGQIVKINSTGQVVPVAISDTTGAFGVAVTSAQQNGDILISIEGSPLVIVDGACVSGNIVSISSTLTGNGHCSGVASGQTIGVMVPGSQSTGFVNVQLSALSSAGVSGGGGGSPGAPTLSTQVNGGSNNFLGAGCQVFTDKDVGPVNNNCDSINKGPNPYTDVRAFGVVSYVSGAAPVGLGMTGTINSGSPTLTVSTASCAGQTGSVCFTNGTGIVVIGAGATHSLTAPTPTVTPSNPSGPMATGQTVAGPAGASTYNYKMVTVDKGRGMSAPGTAGTTVTGQAALGQASAAITSCARAVTTVTCLTAAHKIGVGARVYIDQPSDGTFGGWNVVSGTPDNTHFTFTTGFDTNSGAPAASTGGTVFWQNENKITWTHQANAHQYIVCSDRGGGGFVPIGISKPDDTADNDMALSFDDLGSPIMDNFVLPLWAGTNPCTAGSPQMDELVSTVQAGAGSLTFTLANNAITSVASAPVLADNSIPFGVALSSAQGASHGPIIFPALTGGGFYPFNAYTSLPALAPGGAQLMICQEGVVSLIDTLELKTGFRWSGSCPPYNNAIPAFGWTGHPQISVAPAYPGFYQAGGQANIDSIDFVNGNSNSNQKVLVLLDLTGVPSGSLRDLNFTTGTTNDYLGMGLVLRGAPSNATSNVPMTGNFGFNGGSGSGLNGSTDAPLFYADAAGVIIDNISFGHRGISYKSAASPSGTFQVIRDIYENGGVGPLISMTSGGVSQNIHIGLATEDTIPHPLVANYQAAGTILQIDNLNAGPSVNGSNAPPLTSGLPMTIVDAVGHFSIPSSYTASINAANFSNNFVEVNGTTGDIGYALPSPAAPTVAISGGTGPANGTYTYSIFAVDAFGNNSNISAASAPITVNGSQGVLVSWTPVVGQVRTTVCRINVCPFVGTAGFQILGNSFLDTGYFPSISINQIPTIGMQSGIASQGLETQMLTLDGVQMISPDSAYDNFNRADGGIGSNWTAQVNTINITTNAIVGTNAAHNEAFYNQLPSSISSSGQFAEASVAVLSGGVGPTVNATTGGSNYYGCIESSGTLVLQRGPSTNLATASPTTAVGDVLRMEANPNSNPNLKCTLTSLLGVVTTLTANDSILTGGAPGVYLFGSAGKLDNWSGGALHPYAQLDIENDWTQAQHIISALTVGQPNPIAGTLGQGNIYASGVTSSVGGVTTGTSPPACTGGTAGVICMAEGTDVTNVAGASLIEALSSTHEFGAKTNGASSAGMLERVQPGPISLSAQTAAISTATLCASAAGACNSAGAYHVHWSFIEDGTACSTPSTGGVTFLLTWTDANGTAHSAISLPMEDGSSVTSTSATFHFQTSLAAAWASGDFNISSNGSIIQYATGYTACSVGTGSYRIQAEVTRLQ